MLPIVIIVPPPPIHNSVFRGMGIVPMMLVIPGNAGIWTSNHIAHSTPPPHKPTALLWDTRPSTLCLPYPHWAPTVIPAQAGIQDTRQRLSAGPVSLTTPTNPPTVIARRRFADAAISILHPPCAPTTPPNMLVPRKQDTNRNENPPTESRMLPWRLLPIRLTLIPRNTPTLKPSSLLRPQTPITFHLPGRCPATLIVLKTIRHATLP